MKESPEKITSDPRDPFAALEYILHEEETRKRVLENGQTFSQRWEDNRIASRKTQIETIRGLLARLDEGNADDDLKAKIDRAREQLKELEKGLSLE